MSIERPAYYDAIKNIRWDTSEADLEGVLTKKSKWIGEWRERYFILKGPKLFFTKSSTDAPHGIIDLVDCVHVGAINMSFKAHTIEIVMRDSERFILSAPTKGEKDLWLQFISKALVRASSAHVME